MKQQISLILASLLIVSMIGVTSLVLGHTKETSASIKDVLGNNVINSNVLSKFYSTDHPTQGPVACYSNLECPPRERVNFRSNAMTACAQANTWTCIKPGTPQSYCSQNAAVVSCNVCASGCSNGHCL